MTQSAVYMKKDIVLTWTQPHIVKFKGSDFLNELHFQMQRLMVQMIKVLS